MEKKKWKVEVFDDGTVIYSFIDEAISAKGIEKKNKAKFKEYRKSGYSWYIEEVINV